MAAAAVLGGARSHAAIAEFAREVPKQLLARVGGWLACQQDAPGAVAVDGKTLRGAVDADGRQVHLLAALAHGSGVVLAQRRVDAKSNEITGFRPLLEGVDLQGRVVTADALHTQTEHARYLVGDRQADYLFCVKGNQPTLEAAISHLPQAAFPPGASRDVVPPRQAGAGHPAPHHRPFRWPPAHRGRLRHHQSGRCPGRPRPAGGAGPRPVGDREPGALGARCGLRRGPLSGPHGARPPGDGDLAKPGDQPAAAGRVRQYRPRGALDGSRPDWYPRVRPARHLKTKNRCQDLGLLAYQPKARSHTRATTPSPSSAARGRRSTCATQVTRLLPRSAPTPPRTRSIASSSALPSWYSSAARPTASRTQRPGPAGRSWSAWETTWSTQVSPKPASASSGTRSHTTSYSK